MAEIKNGPLGNISGKIGNMVASNWRDISYVRGLPKRSKKEPNDVQKLIRMKFDLMQNFLSQVAPLIKLGFGGKNTSRATAMNLAFAANSGAFTGDLETLAIDLAKVKISDGKLTPIFDTAMEASVPGKVNLSWSELGEVSGQATTDRIHVALYNATKGLHAIYIDAATRHALQAEISVPVSFAGDEVHGYVFATTATGEKSSLSFYLPAVTIL